ncbi:hypothetical protein MNBD_DELTA01-2025 [hydrothermal vent metagenome]|uniref:Adenosyl-chloride synthase n=1 Tax=hydrothermal vent metagenome TaxID=652676 RepID=A0A3B0R000_9ZZZZ
MASIITLTTDFGRRDPWVGAVKGVILSINPEATIVDISHGISPQKIIEGSFVLSRAYPYYPEGTIHVAVVDPGVGTERRPVLIETERYFFIGPDNGLFTRVISSEKIKQVIELDNSDYFLKDVSATFHARDVFAPVAAHLSCGVKPSELGTVMEEPLLIDLPKAEISPDIIRGEVLYIDSFGNLITNIKETDISEMLGRGDIDIDVRWRTIHGLVESYTEGELGQNAGNAVALIGSSGFMEIAAYRDNAASALGVSVGEKVDIRLRPIR